MARKIPSTHVHERVLGAAATEETWLTYEARTPRFSGPQGACHPDDLELSIVLAGAGCARLGGSETLVPERHYAVIGPGVEHSSWTTDAPAVELNVHLSRSLLERAAATLGARASELADWPREAFVTPVELSGIATALVQEATRPDPSPLALEGLGLYLASFLLDRHRRSETPAAHLAAGSERRLARSIELMHAALRQPLTLDALAATAGMGRFRYVHAFKARYGLAPYAYLTRMRAEAAAALIEGTDLSLTRIAQEVGFGSSSRLSEAFKRRFGHAPSRWRAARRQMRK